MTLRDRRFLFFWIALIAAGARAQTGSTADPAPASLPQREVLRNISDFGGLEEYAEANKQLPAAPANRVVFLGNSITEFWGKSSPFLPGEPYLNRGIAGQTTAQMLIGFRQDVSDLEPAAVVIQGGLADIAGFAGPSSLVEPRTTCVPWPSWRASIASTRFSWERRLRPTIRGAPARSLPHRSLL